MAEGGGKRGENGRSPILRVEGFRRELTRVDGNLPTVAERLADGLPITPLALGRVIRSECEAPAVQHDRHLCR